MRRKAGAAGSGKLKRENVFRVVESVPEGFVVSYAQVAALAGCPGAQRAVGRFLHSNDMPVTRPCHRVVYSDGRLSPAYAFGGEGVQRMLLEREGVLFTPSGKVDPRCFLPFGV